MRIESLNLKRFVLNALLGCQRGIDTAHLLSLILTMIMSLSLLSIRKDLDDLVLQGGRRRMYMKNSTNL